MTYDRTKKERPIIATPSPQGAHPLATDLAELYRRRGLSGPVIEIALGSGRNTRYFVDAGIPIVSTRDEDNFTQLPGGRNLYGAALSTHGYLHGTVPKLRAGFAELRRVLRPGAPIFVTLASIADARFGLGMRVDDTTFAPGDGAEAGIPHTYFDRAGVQELLAPSFVIDELEEKQVDDIVGRWAHAEPTAMCHWFVRARRVDEQALPVG